MLPKTATNYHKFKKGLYLNPLKGHPFDFKQEALARSLHLLKNQGEVMHLQQQYIRKPVSSEINQHEQLSDEVVTNGIPESAAVNTRNFSGARPPANYMQKFDDSCKEFFGSLS